MALKLKRGSGAPGVTLVEGEPYLDTATGDLYIGDGSVNIKQQKAKFTRLESETGIAGDGLFAVNSPTDAYTLTITGADYTSRFTDAVVCWYDGDTTSYDIATVTYTSGNTVIEVTSEIVGYDDTDLFKIIVPAAVEVDSVAEGYYTIASGNYSHAEGGSTTASGFHSHAEGSSTEASGNGSHAEGYYTTASGFHSHTEGSSTIASGNYSHAEGNSTIASGDYSHAEGESTEASRDNSHAEGYNTIASGTNSHAEGYNTTASGYASHAEGESTEASGTNSHAEGESTEASGDYSHTEGSSTTASGTNSHAEGSNTVASGTNSHAEGYNTTASGYASHVEGYNTIASGSRSHAEGFSTMASGNYSHAEGFSTTASGDYSHAEGFSTTASGDYSHAEGYNTTASGPRSHAEGESTEASGESSHAEGHNTEASGLRSHAGGMGAQTVADYDFVRGNTGSSPSPANNIFRIHGDNGNVTADGTFTGGGADYAETFEWADGNPENEDRAGWFVELVDGDKIQKYSNTSIPPLGIVSTMPAVVGDAHYLKWQGIWQTDDFGRKIMSQGWHKASVEITETRNDTEYKLYLDIYKDSNGEIWKYHESPTNKEPLPLGEGIVLPEEIEWTDYQFPLLNPAYELGHKYVPRLERQEWDAIGFIGKLRVFNNDADSGDWVKPTANGAQKTTAQANVKYRVLKRISDNVIEILFR